MRMWKSWHRWGCIRHSLSEDRVWVRREGSQGQTLEEQSMHLKETKKEAPQEKHKTPVGEEYCHMTTARRWKGLELGCVLYPSSAVFSLFFCSVSIYSTLAWDDTKPHCKTISKKYIFRKSKKHQNRTSFSGCKLLCDRLRNLEWQNLKRPLTFFPYQK